MTDEDLIVDLNRLFWLLEEDRQYCARADTAKVAAGRIKAQAAEIERLRGDLEKAEWLLVDASVQLEEGRIKTRRNRASLIRQFLAALTGAKP